MNVKVFIEICRDGVSIPAYQRSGDAGMDICAAQTIALKPGETAVIPTGLKLAVPAGFELQIRPRSGISLRTPLRLSNSPGTIDCGYRDEVGILITNHSAGNGEKELSIDNKGNSHGTYIIKKGDRIAQMVLQEVPRIVFEEVRDIGGIGEDRGGGFGSTGVR